MTAEQPQQESVCDEIERRLKAIRCPDEGSQWIKGENNVVNWMLNTVIPEIRSRQHSAIELEPVCYEDAHLAGFQNGFEEGKFIGAKSERERVLALLEEWDYWNNRNFGKPHPVFSDMIRMIRENPDEVAKHLISLRSEQEKEATG